MPVRTKIKGGGPGLFFVTTTVSGHAPIFRRRDLALTALKQFSETSERFNVSVAAYVLMPSHLHALVKLENICSLSKYMQSFKSLSARKVKSMNVEEYQPLFYSKGRYRFWRRGFDDLLIYSERQVKIKIDYIHNNPVKAGLAAIAENYPYSSAKQWLCGSNGVVPLDREFTLLTKDE